MKDALVQGLEIPVTICKRKEFCRQRFYILPVGVIGDDILPTVARHLNVSLSASQMRELDGVPLTGKVSIYKPEIVAENGKTVLKWLPADDQGRLKVWIASTNNFKESGLADTYKLLGEVPIKDGSFTLDLSKLPSSAIYKIVLEAKYNILNRWIVNKK